MSVHHVSVATNGSVAASKCCLLFLRAERSWLVVLLLAAVSLFVAEEFTLEAGAILAAAADAPANNGRQKAAFHGQNAQERDFLGDSQ
jgi:hypothetical protein